MAGSRTEEWLKTNDPDYNNRDKLEYPYLVGKQIGRRFDKEVPASCLDTYLAQEWTGMDGEQLKEVQDLFT